MASNSAAARSRSGDIPRRERRRRFSSRGGSANEAFVVEKAQGGDLRLTRTGGVEALSNRCSNGSAFFSILANDEHFGAV